VRISLFSSDVVSLEGRYPQPLTGLLPSSTVTVMEREYAQETDQGGSVPHRMKLAVATLGAWVFLAGGPAAAEPRWAWPVENPRVIRGFDPPEQRWLAGHRGIDIAAQPGSAIHAVGAGIITFSGVIAGKPVVVVSHGQLRSTYEPVNASVKKDDRVIAGQVIGYLVSGHCPTGCLHMGLRRGDAYVDPRVVLSPARLLSGSPARG
jgi:murein DD-endopeptidase MepM/ murein hydrolase activator NlpD